MQYSKIKGITGCLLPSLAYLIYESLGFDTLLLWSPLAMGICAALLVTVIVSPLEKRLMLKELRQKGDTFLAHWDSRQPKVDFYLGYDGYWFNGKGVDWSSRPGLTLHKIGLRDERDAENAVLEIVLCHSTERKSYYETVEVPVPRKAKGEARAALEKLLDRHIVLDDKGERLTRA